MNNLVDTKSVQILKRASKTFDVPYGRVRYLGNVRHYDVDLPCYHRGRSIDGTSDGSHFPHTRVAVIHLRGIAVLRNDNLNVTSRVVAGQCPFCGDVAVGEYLQEMSA